MRTRTKKSIEKKLANIERKIHTCRVLGFSTKKLRDARAEYIKQLKSGK